jgi:hypothetical protein
VVGEAQARAAGRVSGGGASRAAARFGQRRQVCRAQCQEMSRVVKRGLDGVINDINGLCGDGGTFCPSGGRVKAGARARAGGAASGGGHEKTLARILFFRKQGFGRSGCLKSARRLPSPCSPSRPSRFAVADANLDGCARQRSWMRFVASERRSHREAGEAWRSSRGQWASLNFRSWPITEWRVPDDEKAKRTFTRRVERQSSTLSGSSI